MGYGDLLRDLAKKFRDLEIVKHGTKIYTFSKFNTRANQVAHALLQLNVKKSDKFGILLYNSPEYLEIMFGLMKIGAVPVPINTRFGFTEFKHIFENSDLIGVFIDGELTEKLQSFIKTYDFKAIQYIFVINSPYNEIAEDMRDYERFIKHQETSDPEAEISDEDIALLLYTGGTTGLPKGAVLTHSNLKNATFIAPKHGMKLVMANKIPAESMIPKGNVRIKFLTPTPIYHISGLMPVLTQIGLRNLLYFPESHSFNPEEICRIIETEKITTLFMVPTMYRIWLESPYLDKYDLSSLTMLASGGAKLPQHLKIIILERFPHVTLVDGYGSTETIGTSTIAFMTHKDIPKIKKGYIGQVVTGIKMRVINEKGEDVPVGEVGEMIYKGKTIMKGYYKDATKTKAVFTEDGWLHSGDLCKIDEEGNVYYVGRMSEMITSGGEKIFPLEIEEVLRMHPKINEVVVTGVPDKIWGQKIAAFIELKKGEEMTAEEVIDYCKDKIATYKKPRIIKFISKIPITKSGKMDRIQIRKMARLMDLDANT
ncbi:MAG: class I adenylate-forming enzyme family protein [Candidatus Helarchaeota archaeon]